MTKISSIFHTPTLKPTWIQGDMHMDNFGAFQNEDGTIVFDVNDFDEGYVGSYLYDIIRMSVSIALYLEEQGVHRTAQETAIQHLLNSYMDQLKRFQRKQDDPLTLVFTKENTKGPAKKLLKKARETSKLPIFYRIYPMSMKTGNDYLLAMMKFSPLLPMNIMPLRAHYLLTRLKILLASMAQVLLPSA
ncbi:DUF2252 domain-containing protein [Lysinibacillus sp. MHQ-1]|nr:DUF2252 domain-containing protein [Lysinibacillus sp. MHQ-1]